MADQGLETDVPTGGLDAHEEPRKESEQDHASTGLRPGASHGRARANGAKEGATERSAEELRRDHGAAKRKLSRPLYFLGITGCIYSIYF